jgi:soluble lytic murein transglycosylase-like protein
MIWYHSQHGGLTGLIAIMVMSVIAVQGAMADRSTAWIEQIITRESLKTKYVPPSLALAVAATESSFRPRVVSNAGAIGVMQIMPATAHGLYNVQRSALFDPQTNIRIGVQFLNHLIQKYNGRIDLALSHYNGGSRVIRNGTSSILPYTRTYVSEVLKRAKHYKNALATANQQPLTSPLAVQQAADYAMAKSGSDVSIHIGHVDKWLSVIDELGSSSR